jgi:hypothetical protein
MDNGFFSSPTPGLTMDEYNMGNYFVKDNYKYGTCLTAHTVAGAAIGGVSNPDNRRRGAVVGIGTGYLTGTRAYTSDGGGCNIF